MGETLIILPAATFDRDICHTFGRARKWPSFVPMKGSLIYETIESDSIR